MKLTISVAALVAAMAGPVLAQDASDPSTMTCADFMAMDEAGMTAALGAMQSGMGEMGAAGTATDTAAADTTGDAAATEDTASTDMASADATADTAATDTATADAGASADAASPMGMDDPVVEAMTEACTADPGMMAMDAYTQASTM